MTRRDRLFMENLDLAKRIAVTFCSRSKVKAWAHDDIFAAAQYGLLMAATRSDTSEREGFRRFACKHIKGAICDWSRNLYNERRLLKMRRKNPDRTIMMVDVYARISNRNYEDREEYIPAKDDGEAKNVDDRDEIESMRSRVPAELRSVFDDMVAGRTLEQMAQIRHVTESRMSQVVKVVKEAAR